MKHFVILLSIIFVGLISFTGCEKDTFQDLPTNNPNATVTTKAVGGGSWGIHRHFFDNGNYPGVEGIDYGCRPPAKNCFDVVIVTPKNNDVKRAIHEIIDNHNERSDVLARDIPIFKEYKNALSGIVFTREDIDNLINGVYHLRIRGSKSIISKTENNYYIFEKGKEIEKVYPIKIDN